MDNTLSFLMITVIFSLNTYGSIDAWSCPDVSPERQALYRKIFKSMKNQPKEADQGRVDRYIRTYSLECNDKKFINSAKDEYESLRYNERIARINFLKKEMSRVSDFRPPNSEWKEIELLSSKIKESAYNHIAKPELARLRRKGLSSQKKIENTCYDKDNQKLLLKRHIRDQSDIGWCYALVAADLLSHHSEKLISYIDIANSFNNTYWEWIREKSLSLEEWENQGGTVNKAIEVALSKGLCEEKDVNSLDLRVKKLKTVFEKTAKLRKELLENRPKELKGRECELVNLGWGDLFPSLNPKELLDILISSNRDDFINATVSHSCKEKRIRINNVKVRIKEKGLLTDGGDLSEVIDKQLNDKNIVGIHYNSSILTDPYTTKDYPHASSIVARKFDKESGSCKYLIRNTYGRKCPNYYKDFECKNGEIWIPKEHLVQSIKGVVYLEK